MCAALALAFAALAAPAAQAEFGFSSAEFSANEQPTPEQAKNNEPGAPDTQAGSHPWALTTAFTFNLTTNKKGQTVTDGDVRDVYANLPPGLVGNPTALPQCTLEQFQTQFTFGSEESSYENSGASCSPTTQVGAAQARLGPGARLWFDDYNLTGPPGVPGQLGFSPVRQPVTLMPTVRSGSDYGLTIGANGLTQFVKIRSSVLTFWGVPANPSHDAQRGECLAGEGGERPHSIQVESPPGSGEFADKACPEEGTTEKPFLSLPTSCSATPPSATLIADSWQDPGARNPDGSPDLSDPAWVTETIPMPAITGCNKVGFAPTLQARPTTSVADAPSGLHVDLKVPQNEAPDGIATAHLKKAVVTLPKGLVVNPSSANGLGACSSAQIGLTSAIGAKPVRTVGLPAQCPDAAKLGTVEVDTPDVDHPLSGSVYLAKPFDNPFNSLLAIYIAVYDPATGIVVKLAGQVETNPENGQITASFDENPQLPFEDFKLDFFGGARAALRTPADCGTYQSTSVLTPYSAPESGPPATPVDSYALSSAPGGGTCPTSAAAEPDKPSFEAGTEAPLAGAYSPFVLKLARADGSQELRSIDATLPPGLTGKLAGVSECSDARLALAASHTGAAEQAAPSCPLGSRLGSADVAAGAGPAPFYAKGTAYLSGPYKGAPLSLAIITPAVAGPFDLGTVVVRSALYVNPETAQITVKSDPIPAILQGIPLDLRSVTVDIDRNQFTLNPTSCDPKTLSATVLSTLGQGAALSNPFQVGGCSALGFKPKVAIRLKGATKRTGHPALSATVTYPKGSYANVARAQVTLPHSEFLDNSHIKTVCTRVQFAADACPAASIYGFAKATTPLLDAPLQGPVYLRSSSNKLPDLVAALNGQIDVDLDGKIDTGKGGGIRNTFEVVPDAPVSKFTLSMQGGGKGLLVNSENLCSAKAETHATVDLTAQNGKAYDTTPAIANGCAGGKGKKHKGHGGR